MRFRIRIVSATFSLVILCICYVFLQQQSGEWNIDIMDIMLLWPMIFNVVCVIVLRSFSAHVILFSTSLCFLVIFFYFYCNVFFLNDDPQSGLLWLIMAFFSPVVMIPNWIICFVFEDSEASKFGHDEDGLPDINPKILSDIFNHSTENGARRR